MYIMGEKIINFKERCESSKQNQMEILEQQ